MSKKRAGIITASVLAAGLAIGGVTTGVVLANRPLDITYYANNGTPAVTTQVNKNETLNLPTPTREGYNFAGWYTDVGLTSQVTKSTKLKQGAKLYAGWELTDGAVLTSTGPNGEATVQAETQGLKSIGAYAFANSKLTSITIPDTVTTIGEHAFKKCENLQTITIGKGVTSIGQCAFAYCKALNKFNYNAIECNDLASAGAGLFYNSGSSAVGIDVIIGDDVKKIPAYLFSDPENYTNVTSVKMGKNVISIGNSAFERCGWLTEIEIPNGVTNIGARAFQYCIRLTGINIPDGITSIRSEVFTGCSSLTNVIIPSGITSIGARAFWNCTSLTNVIIPSGVTSIGMRAFWNCTSFTSIFIPISVTEFVDSNYYALFTDCSSSLQIYCEATSKPSTWGSLWNSNGSTLLNVIWGAAKLDMYSWQEIKAISETGNAAEIFNVGDEKHVTLTDGTVMTMQIADFNHDVDASGNTIGITWVTKELLPSAYRNRMNNSNTNVGGWKDSYMRTYLNSDIYNLLPEDLKASITSAAKKSTAGSASTALGETTEDKLFLLSCAEINNKSTSTGYKDEGTPYALFGTAVPDYTSTPSLVKKYADTGSAFRWWLRSPLTSDAFSFWYVSGDGSVNYNAASTSIGVCFAFCI